MKKRSILMVDDEVANRQLLRAVVASAFPVEIYEASDNEEAWKILRQHKIDIITTDIMRPRENGIEFVRKVRSDQKFTITPILVISAVTRSYVRELTTLKVVSFEKPFNMGDILQLIGMLFHIKKDPYISMLNMGTELPNVDYKGDIDIMTIDGRAALAKDVIAMANYGGGTIIVGVSEVSRGEFKKKGVPSDKLINFEASTINKAIRKFMTPSVAVTVHRVNERGDNYIFLEVPPVGDEIVLVARMNAKASLYPGRIYIRTSACESSEIQEQNELRSLIDRIIRYRLNALVK